MSSVLRVPCSVTEGERAGKHNMTGPEFTSYAKWERSVPDVIRNDALWRMEVYRLSLFASDLAWIDVSRLAQDRRTLGVADQLYRAVCSMGANIAEGYSRNSGKDRARFYEYALGSARESRDWYYKGKSVPGDAVAAHRMELVTQILRLLLTIVPVERRVTKEEGEFYSISDVSGLVSVPFPEHG